MSTSQLETSLVGGSPSNHIYYLQKVSSEDDTFKYIYSISVIWNKNGFDIINW